jgi:NAD(P)H-hydrate epimerase
MTIVTIEEMKAIEDRGEQMGISKLMMMENAGANIADFLNTLTMRNRKSERIRILIIAGTGNNGGDAFVAARHLAYWKQRFEITLALVGKESDIHTKEARVNWMILRKVPSVDILEVRGLEQLPILRRLIAKSRIVITGIFGTGFRSEPREPHKSVIELVNKFRRPIKIAIDVPSGMNADTGKSVCGIESDVTITMHATKKGLLTLTGRKLAGKIVEVNIGVPL